MTQLGSPLESSPPQPQAAPVNPAIGGAVLASASGDHVSNDSLLSKEVHPAAIPSTTDVSHGPYRPPEAVPDLEAGAVADAGDDVPVTTEWAPSAVDIGWGDEPTNSSWDDGNGWDSAQNNSWAQKPDSWNTSSNEATNSWGLTQHNQASWGNLGVLGNDEPWNDDSDRWWDKDFQSTKRKPGPGMLAPCALDTIHEPNHALYEVSIVGNPSSEISNALSPKPSLTAGGPLNSTQTPDTAATSVLSTSTTAASHVPSPIVDTDVTSHSASETSPVPHIPPTPEELRDATPHPSALFCRQHYGWVIRAITTASATASHLGTHWCPAPDKKALFNKLPDPALRQDKDCSESSPEVVPYPTSNWSLKPEQKLHHFHRYSNVVAGSGLYPPLKGASAPAPLAQENVSPLGQDTEMDSVSLNTTWPAASRGPTPKEEYLDLYICCQCKTQILCSPAGSVTPCVIPSEILRRYMGERGAQPKPGQTKEQSVFSSLEMLLRVIEEPLWVGNTKSLAIDGKAFVNKIGWGETSRLLFEAMGFTVDASRVTPPSLETSTPEGCAVRLRLLRVWVEMGAVTAEYNMRHAGLKSTRTNHIRLKNAWDGVAKRLGSHPDQMPRLENVGSLSSVASTAFEALGITRPIATPNIIEAAYGYQLRCNPPETPSYYHALRTLSQQSIPAGSTLQELVVRESSKGRWTPWDLQSATERLGFGSDGVIGSEYIPDEADDDYILAAFQAALKAAKDDPLKRSTVKDSLKILGESRGSHKLIGHYNYINSSKFMDIDEAYRVLDVTQDVEDDTLVVVYQVRVDDFPASKERMQNALLCIAEARNSPRLLELVHTGVDPGKPRVEVPPNFPRGLQQLGNTCYLNSLLQYFYTIKELRDVVGAGNFDLDAPILEEDLLKHRVGGRLVSQREVERSKKFVKLLSTLFTQMTCASEPAITPDIELAKLALVTSKDEEEDATAQTSSSRPTNMPEQQREDIQAQIRDFLGGGPALSLEAERAQTATDAQGFKAGDDVVMASRPSSPPAPAPTTRPVSDPGEKTEPVTAVVPVTEITAEPKEETAKLDGSQDSMVVEAGDRSPTETILPLRKPTIVVDSGAMMFGKQHDVSEVFDNCMFQIEAALRFEASGLEEVGSGTIKKLFYGKILQRLSPIIDVTTSPVVSPAKAEGTIHEKEDLFSHLLVNVSDEGFDLYDGLGGYFEDEVEYGGKRTRMDVSLLDLPPLLQVQLQRVQFDRETMQAFKSNAYIKFEETLLMDRFLANVDSTKKEESKKLQSELTKTRERLRVLTNPGGGANLNASLTGTRAFLSTWGDKDPSIDQDLTTHLDEEVSSVETEISQNRVQVRELKSKLEEFWKDQRQAEYELASVFIHRGTSPSFGHYFFYSRCLPERPDEWFKYNDNEVTSVKKDEVLADSTGSTANPYLLVYVRKGYNVVDTIHRVSIEE